MTRDYKPASRTRKARSSGSGSTLLVGILIGLLLGLGIALAVAIYLNKVPGPFLSRARSEAPAPTKNDAPKPAPSAKAEEALPNPANKPRFDFYNILPGGEDTAKGKTAKEPSRPAWH